MKRVHRYLSYFFGAIISKQGAERRIRICLKCVFIFRINYPTLGAIESVSACVVLWSRARGKEMCFWHSDLLSLCLNKAHINLTSNCPVPMHEQKHGHVTMCPSRPVPSQYSRATISGDRQILCRTGMLCDGNWSSKVVKGSVGMSVDPCKLKMSHPPEKMQQINVNNVEKHIHDKLLCEHFGIVLNSIQCRLPATFTRHSFVRPNCRNQLRTEV